MTQRANRQCSVEMAKWKNALVMYDRLVPETLTMPEYEDCRPSENVLTVNDRTVGNVACGMISSQINQVDATRIARDFILRMVEN